MESLSLEELQEQLAKITHEREGLLADLTEINNIIYTYGLQVGSNDYFMVRKICCEASYKHRDSTPSNLLTIPSI
jgi:hypothetical protein